MRYVNATGIWFFSDCYIGRVLRADGGHDLINDELCADLRSYCRATASRTHSSFQGQAWNLMLAANEGHLLSETACQLGAANRSPNAV